MHRTGERFCAFDGHMHTVPVKNGKAVVHYTLAVPRLWSPNDPYLYEGRLTIGNDCVENYFGVREISTGKVGDRRYEWILLNGIPYI